MIRLKTAPRPNARKATKWGKKLAELFFPHENFGSDINIRQKSYAKYTQMLRTIRDAYEEQQKRIAK